MENREIKIGFIPSDFIDCDYSDNGDCALARAVKRHFNATEVSVDIINVWIDNPFKRKFRNVNHWGLMDFNYVKEQYTNDPLMEKEQYFVTLIEI